MTSSHIKVESEYTCDSDDEYEGSWIVCDSDFLCVICGIEIPEGGRLYTAGEFALDDDFCMCRCCWNRPQHDCMTAWYLDENGQCPDCHSDENKAEEIIQSLLKTIRKYPIDDRGDIVALTACFKVLCSKFRGYKRWFGFLLAHSIREPAFVKKFQRGILRLRDGASCKEIFQCLKGACDIQKQTKAEFIPATCFLSPTFIYENWTVRDCRRLAKDFKATFTGDCPTVSQLNLIAKKIRDILPRFGVYSSEHFVRAACIVSGTKEAGSRFIIMGRGANNKKYDKLRELGLTNTDVINNELKILGYDGTVSPRMLAYFICMGNIL